MKFTCSSKTLRQEMECAFLFVNRKAALSMYSNVYMEASEGRLFIRATNGSDGFSSSLEVNVIEDGSTTVYCEKLLGILKTMPETDITVERKNNKVEITDTDRDKFIINLNTMDNEEFPKMKKPTSEYILIPQRDFIDMTEKTMFAVASDESSRKFFEGVFIEKKGDNKISMVATDGKRLAYVERQIERNIADFPGSIMTTKFITNARDVSSGEGLMGIAIDNDVIFAEFGERTIYSELINESYPKYGKAIPQNPKYSCTVKTSDFEKAVVLASNLSETRSKKVIITISPNGVSIDGEAQEGTISAKMSCSYEGPETEIKFNCAIVLEPIRKMSSEFFSIKFTASDGAVLFIPEPSGDYLFLVMPLVL